MRAMIRAAGTPLSVTSPTTIPIRPSGSGDEVVEVAADRPRRAVVGGHLPVAQLGQLARQELLLDEGGDPHLLLEALAGLDLDRLLADELGDPDRRRRLGREGGEELAVVGAVVLVRQARAEVEGADQLALGDQRDDDPDAGRPQLVEGRRVELEALGVDDAAGRLEVGEERVGRGDLDGGAGRGGRSRRGRGGGARGCRGSPVATGADAASTWSAVLGRGRGRPIPSDRSLDRLDECHDRVLRLHRPETVTGRRLR